MACRCSALGVMWCVTAVLLTTSSTLAQTREDFVRTQALIQQLRAEIQLLHAEVDHLHQKVKTLEAAIAATGTSALPATADAQVLMYLEEMSFTRGAEERSPEINKLKAQAVELEEKAREAREEANRLEKHPWWGSWRHPSAPSWWNNDRARRKAAELEVRRQRNRLTDEALSYEREAQKKRGNAIRLERKAADSVQLLLYGWDGEKSITLEADRDLRHALDGNTSGVFLTWRGRPVSSSLGEGDSWEITSIKLVPEPAGFKWRSEANQAAEEH